MAQALIFDFNGIIVESDSFNRHGISSAAKRLGLPFEAETYERFFSNKPLSVGVSNYLTYIHKPELKNELAALKKMYDGEYVHHLDLHQSTLFFIDRIKKEVPKLALVSEAPRHLLEEAMHKVKRHYVFDAFVGAEDYEKQKPEPDIYLEAIRQLSINPEDAIAIEDTPAGIEAAHIAGMACIAVTHTYPAEVLIEADLTVDTLAAVTSENIATLV